MSSAPDLEDWSPATNAPSLTATTAPPDYVPITTSMAQSTSVPTSIVQISPPYAIGTCYLHIDENQNCLPNANNLYANITIYDNDKNIIGQTPIDKLDPLGNGINISDVYTMDSNLTDAPTVVGEHQGDYIQFKLGSQAWTSRTTTGSYVCRNGGWNPSEGPHCRPKFSEEAHSVCCRRLSCLEVPLLTRNPTAKPD